MWDKLLFGFLDQTIVQGRLHVTLADGTSGHFGLGTGGLPEVSVSIRDPDLPRKLILNFDLAACEAYMDERLIVENDDIRGLLTVVIANMANAEPVWWQIAGKRLRHAGRWFSQFNTVGRAQSNVAHHYDLSGELYDLFLDQDKQYSCGYFPDENMTLEEAQIAKKRHIANKLLIEPGMQVLDIGCGWGGMAITLAREYGARVVGVTLSREQHQVATRRAEEAGLSGQVEFRLQDYRHVPETFDRIVSVGMFEHVGVPHYREYFRHVRNSLKKDGVALIHTIGRTIPPGSTNGFISKYIFPGGYAPAMSEAMKAIEKEKLITCDVEVWRLHYAQTLKLWEERFTANVDRVREIYDDRFVRMWRLYLVACELTFRYVGQVVFQFQLARNQEAVPLTRDYLYAPHTIVPQVAQPQVHAAQ